MAHSEPTRDDVIAQIAEELHRFEHPAYDTVIYCTFCWSIAHDAVAKLPAEDVTFEKLDVAS